MIREIKTEALRKKLKYIESFGETDLQSDIQKLENQILAMYEPELMQYSKPESFIHRSESSFESLCIILQKETPKDIKTLSVYEFWKLLEYLENANSKKK